MDRVRRLFVAVTALLALSPALALADSKAENEIKALESALQRIDQAQQSVYRQFQMVEELRRSRLTRMEEGVPATYGIAAPPVDYEALQQARQQREEQIRRYSEELERLYADYRALEEKKRPLLDRLNELTQAQ